MNWMTRQNLGHLWGILVAILVTLGLGLREEFRWLDWSVVTTVWMGEILLILERTTKRNARYVHILRGTSSAIGVIALIFTITDSYDVSWSWLEQLVASLEEARHAQAQER